MTHAFNLIAGLEAAAIVGGLVLYVTIAAVVGCYVGDWAERRTGSCGMFVASSFFVVGSFMAFLIGGLAR